MQDMKELIEAVNAAEEDTILCHGWDLRAVGGESRLKELARERIQEKLAREGLIAIPDVPQDQHDPVYVTRLGSDVDKLSRALNEPTEGGLQILRGAAGGSQPVVNQQEAVREAMSAIEEAGQALASVVNGDGHR